MTNKRHHAAPQQEGREPQAMPIGEFGGAPTPPGDEFAVLPTPLYWFYEMSHAALNPSRALADVTRLYFKNPINALSYTTFGKSMAAACVLFERSARRYGKAVWAMSAAVCG